MRRLCYVIPSLNAGGTERQLLYMMEGLLDDYELTVVCTSQGGAFIEEARRLGSHVHILDGHGGWDFRTRHKLKRLFRRHRPDIVHTFLFGFDLPAARAARETGVPVVISSRRQLATWKKKRHIRHQQRANELVDCIVANSETAKDFAIEQEVGDPRLYRVIRNGLDADAFVSAIDPREVREKYKIPQDKTVVGIVANFSPVKDHALFLEIAGELMRRRENLHFLMVGTGSGRKEILRIVRGRGWGDDFTRVASLNEMPDLLKLMSVSVLCSKMEGFPNAVMESMAAGVPVVASAVGGIPELVTDGQTGRLVHSRNAGDFADAIQTILDNREQADRMSSAASDFVRSELSLEKMLNAYRDLYNELLAKAFRSGA